METDTARLETYIEKLRTDGEKVPCHTEKARPHFVRISAASGVSRQFLLSSQGRERITLAVEELGLDKKHGPAQAKQGRQAEQNAELISTYLQRLEAKGLKLPENPNRRREVFMAQVEVEAGLTPGILNPRKSKGNKFIDRRLVRIIKDAAQQLGLDVRILTHPVGIQDPIISYRLLLEKGTQDRKLELVDKASAKPQLYNTRTALTQFCKALGLGLEYEVGSEFVLDFGKSVDVVLSGMASLGSRRKFQTEIGRWRDYYERLIKESSLPTDFHQSLARLVNMSGLNLSILGKLLGVRRGALSPWYRGVTTPSSKNLAAISRMESLCKLPSGSLVNKLPRASLPGRITPSMLPPPLQENEHLARIACPHLPSDYLALSLEKQVEVFESVCNEVLTSSEHFNKRQAELLRLPYALKVWPDAPEREFEHLAHFKTADRPPLGMDRNKKWTPATAGMARQDFDLIFGALCLPADAEDIRMRGLGMSEDQLTLALIACPLIVDWFLRFRCEARTQYTSYTSVQLQRFMSLLAAKTGWLRQKPELGLRLRPVTWEETTLISQEFVERARNDWDGVCQEAVETYSSMCKKIEPLITQSRKPFQPIEAILDMENPMEAFEVMLRGMRDELPNKRTQPALYHTAIRNCALVALIATTGFRRNTVAQLNYTGSESGHLTLRDELLVLDVPRPLFKHPESPFFGPKDKKSDYYDQVPNVYWVVDIFSEYLDSSRPFLIKRFQPSCVGQPLFVMSGSSKNARMSPDSLSSIYYKVAGRYLRWNKWRGTGIPNVWPSGPHSARHIRGTAVVKKTGSFLLAGYANQHTEQMAFEHYTKFTTQDRNSRVRTALYGEDIRASTAFAVRGSWLEA